MVVIKTTNLKVILVVSKFIMLMMMIMSLMNCGHTTMKLNKSVWETLELVTKYLFFSICTELYRHTSDTPDFCTKKISQKSTALKHKKEGNKKECLITPVPFYPHTVSKRLGHRDRSISTRA